METSNLIGLASLASCSIPAQLSTSTLKYSTLCKVLSNFSDLLSYLLACNLVPRPWPMGDSIIFSLKYARSRFEIEGSRLNSDIKPGDVGEVGDEEPDEPPDLF